MQSLGHNNPYVGPRTFRKEERDRFFGRTAEARELLSLVISERLVLIYAKSGAGKSSLINTSLIPQLQEEGFATLPISRVSGTYPPDQPRPRNIFSYNLMSSLDHKQAHIDHFSQISLKDFLARLTSLDGETYFYDHEAPTDEAYESSPYVLIIDQFEEIITGYPTAWSEREEFFKQLNEAMQADPHLWVVLALREDYIAALDPYAALVPNNLRARFYLQRPTCDAALEAIKKPAELAGRHFAPGVAETLVNNLRQIRVPGSSTPQPGQFIEPVQLQVVCYQLWENLNGKEHPEITQNDLPLDYISYALREFYEVVIHRVARQTGVSVYTLREWFDRELITESYTRGTVYRGEQKTGGLINEAADLLAQHYLLRAELRSGGTWYELTHDRFINPIRRSNARHQLTRLKRWRGTSMGLSSFILVGFIVTLIFKLFWDRADD